VKLLFDFFPLILMFAAYKMYDIYVATIVAIVATFVQVAYLKIAGKKVEPMMWFGLAIIVIFGGATIIFKNEMFIKWKPTILFGAMAVVIAFAQFVYKKNPISIIFNNQLQLPDHIWRTLSISWILFLLLIAILNLVFAYYTSTDTWFLFKTFGDTAMMIVFIIAQMLWLMPYLPKDEEEAAPSSTSETADAPIETASNANRDADLQASPRK
jgi:intracellular septation protein